MNELDRPERNSLVYLTKVRGHKITRDPQLKDPYVEAALSELLGPEILSEYKEYTRSFYTLEGHYKNLWLYDRKVSSRVRNRCYYNALAETRLKFRLPEKVESIRWDDLKSVPFISTSGAGWTYVGKKGTEGNHDLAVKRAVGTLYSWRERDPQWRYTPDLAWTRTQLGSFERPKIRNVWGKSFHNIILEGINAYPLIHAYQNWTDSPMVVGIHLYKVLPMVIHDVLQDGDTPQIGIGIDFKSFDSCPQPWMIEDAFSILEENITFRDEEAREAWDFSKHHFIETPVIMPDGRMWLKKVGIPSGSYFTQLIGSVVNHIVISYVQMRVWNRYFKLRVLGDDSAFGIPYELGWPDLNKVCHAAAELGFIVHPDKVVVAQRPDEMEFLGHVARGTRVDRDTGKLLRLALFPEYPVASPEMSLSRIKGLLVDSAMNSWPLLNLANYMSVKYKTEGGKKFDYEDKNWLEAVLSLNLSPDEIDAVKAWTLT